MREIVRLLMQVAWADDEVSPQEVEHVLHLAREWTLSSEEIAEIRAGLHGEAVLAAPDLGLLKRHRDRVLEAVEGMIRADTVIADDEMDTLAQIRALLS